MLTVQDLITKATEAGHQTGTATDRVRDCIEAAGTNGYTAYDCDAVKSMRAAYVTAAKSTAAPDDASQARAKAAAHNMFSKAWDSLVGQYGIQGRPRKGTGRNAGKASKSDGDASGDESSKSAKREITAADVPRAVRREIERAAVKAFMESSKLGAALGAMAESKEAFADALRVLGDIARNAEKADDKLNARLAKSGTGFVKDAGFAFSTLGRAVESALKSGGVDVDAPAKPAKPAKPARSASVTAAA